MRNQYTVFVRIPDEDRQLDDLGIKKEDALKNQMDIKILYPFSLNFDKK